jgi:hypothetical protein
LIFLRDCSMVFNAASVAVKGSFTLCSDSACGGALKQVFGTFSTGSHNSIEQ